MKEYYYYQNMNILAWIIFGLSVGIIANSIDPKPAYGGVIGAMFLGVTGAMIGGIISALFLSEGFSALSLTSVFIAVGGALSFLMLGKSVRKT